MLVQAGAAAVVGTEQAWEASKQKAAQLKQAAADKSKQVGEHEHGWGSGMLESQGLGPRGPSGAKLRRSKPLLQDWNHLSNPTGAAQGAGALAPDGLQSRASVCFPPSFIRAVCRERYAPLRWPPCSWPTPRLSRRAARWRRPAGPSRPPRPRRPLPRWASLRSMTLTCRRGLVVRVGLERRRRAVAPPGRAPGPRPRRGSEAGGPGGAQQIFN